MDMILNVRKKIIFFMILSWASFAVSVALAAEPPEFSGAYKDHLVWKNEVTMAGDVLILAGGSLTIHAGTKIRVVPADGTKIDPEYLSPLTELLIRGRLDIQGTADEPVRFVIVERDDLDAIAWSGITLDNSVGSRINHIRLERGDIGIRCVNSSPEITNSQITNCRYGVVAQQQSHPRIIGNTLAKGEAGIFCWRASNPVLQDNIIDSHDEEGLFVDASSKPIIGRNKISNNAIGLALYPRDLDYTAAELHENTENLRWLGSQGQDGGR